MIQIIPEIYVNNCKQALPFYQKVFGGEVKNLQISDDLELFRDFPGKVIHSELHVNSRCVFYFIDALDRQRAQTGNITTMLHLESHEEARRLFRALKVNGTVLMDLQKTFWNAWHAIVTDRFGAPWALNYAKS